MAVADVPVILNTGAGLAYSKYFRHFRSMLTGTLRQTTPMAETKRIFIEVTDIMLLEGVTEKTARKNLHLALITLGKVPERKEDIYPDRKIRLTVEDYAYYTGCTVAYLKENLPDIPFPLKHFSKA